MTMDRVRQDKIVDAWLKEGIIRMEQLPGDPSPTPVFVDHIKRHTPPSTLLMLSEAMWYPRSVVVEIASYFGYSEDRLCDLFHTHLSVDRNFMPYDEE